MSRNFSRGLKHGWLKIQKVQLRMSWKVLLGLMKVSQATDKSPKSTSQKSSRVSSKSKTSASAAFLQAEVEHAALKAKAQTLEQKHILDLEEAKLKAKKEKLALESEMAAADAKVNIFLKSESLLEKIILKSAEGSAKSDTSSTYPSTEYIAPARTPKVKIKEPKGVHLLQLLRNIKNMKEFRNIKGTCLV